MGVRVAFVLAGLLLGVGRCLVDWGHYGTGQGVWAEASVDALCGEISVSFGGH